MRVLSFITFFLLFVLNNFGQHSFVYSNVSDCAACDGSIDISSEVLDEVTYSWFDADGVLLFSESNTLGLSSLSNLCQGLYIIQLEYVNTIDEILVSISDIPFVQPIDTILCSTQENILLSNVLGTDNTGTWTLDGIPGYNAQLNGVDLNDGLYIYSENQGGCIYQSAIDLIVNDPANPGLSTTYLICEDYVPFYIEDFLAGSPDPSGVWTDSNGDVFDGWFDPEFMESELFTYEIDTVLGCAPVVSTLFVVKNYYSNPGINTEVFVCEDASSFNLTEVLDGNPDDFGQWWSPSLQTVEDVFDPLTQPDGTYIYVVGAAAPCSSLQAELTIEFVDAIDAGQDNTLNICNTEGSFDLLDQLNGNPDDNGVWMDLLGNAVDPIFDPPNMSSSTFIYEVSAFGCEDEQAVLIIENEEYQYIGESFASSICNDQDSYVLYDLLPEEVSSMGNWYQNDLIIESIIYTNELSSDPLIYSITSDFCEDQSIELEILVDTLYYAGDNFDQEFCQSDEAFNLNDILMNSESNDGIWYFEDEEISPTINPDDLNSGTYSYLISGQGVCPDSEAQGPIYIWEDVQMPFLENYVVCENGSNFPIGIEDPGVYDFTWFTSDYLNQNDVSFPTFFLEEIPSNIQSLIYEVQVTNGLCSTIDSVSIQINELPSLSIENQYQFCLGESISLNIEEGETASWLNEEDILQISETEFVIEPQSSMDYEVSLTSEDGCSADFEFSIEIIEQPDASAELIINEGCAPLLIQAQAIQNNEDIYEYYWLLDGEIISDEQNLEFVQSSSGIFEIQLLVSSSNGCAELVEFEDFIQAYDSPNAFFEFVNDPSPYFPVIQFNNLSSDNDFNFWTNENVEFSTELNPDFFLDEYIDGYFNFCLTVENNFGCRDSICREVIIYPEVLVYVPSAFTPDFDGVNDYFKPILWGTDPYEYHFSIYNRWGEKIFYTIDPNEAWNGGGAINSEYFSPNDQYVWQVEYKKSINSDKEKLLGKVQLIR